MKYPKCGRDSSELDELGTGVDGEVSYGCQECNIRFTVYFDFDNELAEDLRIIKAHRSKRNASSQR